MNTANPPACLVHSDAYTCILSPPVQVAVALMADVTMITAGLLGDVIPSIPISGNIRTHTSFSLCYICRTFASQRHESIAF